MKDSENIKSLNKIAVSYLLLSGLGGNHLNNQNPFMKYIMFCLLSGEKQSEEENDNQETKVITVPFMGIEKILDEKNIQYVPNELFHILIKESYNLYTKLDKISKTDNELNQQLSMFLGNVDFKKMIEETIDNYKTSLVDILTNYNSKRVEYNEIKINILTDEMNLSAKFENYHLAAYYRDKIKEVQKKMETE